MGLVANFQISGCLAPRNIRVGGGPLRSPFAALKTETGLLAGNTLVVVGELMAIRPVWTSL